MDRIAKILDEDPGALDRPFSEYGLFPHDAEGWYTPAAYAAMRGRTEIVRLLLERGADRTLHSPAGESLKEIAMKAGHGEVADVL
jgi:ankyrin repeat protein